MISTSINYGIINFIYNKDAVLDNKRYNKHDTFRKKIHR